MAQSFHTIPASYFITLHNVPCYQEILKKMEMQTRECLNLLNSLKHHNNGPAWKSKWAWSSFWDKSRNIHPGMAGFVEVLGITHGQTQRKLFAPKIGLQIWIPGVQNDKVLPHWALPLQIASAFLLVHQSKWWINFILLFPKTPVFKEKKEALQASTYLFLLLETRYFILQCEGLICFQVFHGISPSSNTLLQAEFNTDPS